MVTPLAVPAQKVPGYRMPEHDQNLLPWSFVVSQMESSRHFWLTTTHADGRPHSVPVWGLWFENRIHFEGGMQTTWARHLVRDPRSLVHPGNGEQVVVIEGVARIVEDDDLSDAEWAVLDEAFQAKYDVDKGSPYWCIEPTKVVAWDGGGLETMTRWLFDPPSDGLPVS